MSFPRSLKPLSLLSVAAIGVACSDDGVEPQPSDPVLAAVSGTGQTATVGEPVADPLVVRVTQGGSPVSGRSVSWSVTAGGGSVSPTSSTTDGSGNASTTWTLGATPGAQSVEASSSGITGTVEYLATAIEDTPPPATASVDVRDNLFDPDRATVAVGGSVTWTWTGSALHNVTFGSGSNASDRTSGTFTRAFPDAGSYDYQCTNHSGMSGTIVVR